MSDTKAAKAATATHPGTQAPDDFLKIRGTDHVEFYVGNAKQAAYYYAHAFGFAVVAYSGLETGVRDRASYVLQQGKVRFVLTAPLQPDGAIAEHVHRHGDGVRDIALDVEDVDRAYEGTTKRGARTIVEPHDVTDENGTIRHAAIATYGDTIHSFVDRSKYRGIFMPGFKATGMAAADGPLLYVDHMVGNVPLGDMNRYVAYYRDVMGFSQWQHFDDKDISTEYSALMSKVMADGSGRIKFPINEPAEGRRKSQIEEYLEYYRGAGVQHVALATKDIIDTVGRLRDSGVAILTVPPSYYEMLPGRVG